FGSTYANVFSVGQRVNNLYTSMGGEDGRLGSPVSNEVCNLTDTACVQKFKNGEIYWTQQHGAASVMGSIRKYWVSTGAESGPLGYPIGQETAIEGGGWQQQYQNGYIVGSYPTGYWLSKGSIRSHWVSLGAEQSSLGLPVGPELAMHGGGW